MLLTFFQKNQELVVQTVQLHPSIEDGLECAIRDKVKLPGPGACSKTCSSWVLMSWRCLTRTLCLAT